MDLNIPIQVNGVQGNEPADGSQAVETETNQATSTAPTAQSGDASYARQVELANLISQAQNLDELKGHIKKAIEEGYASSSFLIEKATARKKELSENPVPATEAAVPEEAPIPETAPETNAEPSIVMPAEEVPAEAASEVQVLAATEETGASETNEGQPAEAAPIAIEISTPAVEGQALEMPQTDIPATENVETEVAPQIQEAEQVLENAPADAANTFDITFADPNAENGALSPAGTPEMPASENVPETQAVEVPQVTVSAPVVEMATAPETPQQAAPAEEVPAATETPEEDPVLVHEKKLLKQFDSLMGELVVMAAESQIINDDDRKHAAEVTEKLKKTWTDICEKRGKSINDKESQYIFQIIGQQISKINNK